MYSRKYILYISYANLNITEDTIRSLLKVTLVRLWERKSEMQSIGGGRRYQSFKRRRISLLFAIRIGRRTVGELRQSSRGRSLRCIHW
jgi:hypothetical protein